GAGTTRRSQDLSYASPRCSEQSLGAALVRLLELEQGALALEAARVPGEGAVGTDHAVAGHDDAQRAPAHALADALGEAAGSELRGERGVGGRLSVGDLLQQRPHACGEVVAAGAPRQVELLPLAGEVLLELLAGAGQQRIGVRLDRGAEPFGARRMPVPGEVQPGQRLLVGRDGEVSEARAEGGAARSLHEGLL